MRKKIIAATAAAALGASRAFTANSVPRCKPSNNNTLPVFVGVESSKEPTNNGTSKINGAIGELEKYRSRLNGKAPYRFNPSKSNSTIASHKKHYSEDARSYGGRKGVCGPNGCSLW